MTKNRREVLGVCGGILGLIFIGLVSVNFLKGCVDDIKRNQLQWEQKLKNHEWKFELGAEVKLKGSDLKGTITDRTLSEEKEQYDLRYVDKEGEIHEQWFINDFELEYLPRRAEE